MDHQLISSLMANNDKAREQVLELNNEVMRLKKRETELTSKIQALLPKLMTPINSNQDGEDPDVAKLAQEFSEWLLMFRMEADAPSANNASKTPAEEEECKTDLRSAVYSPAQMEAKAEQQLPRLLEELRLLQRLKRREKMDWLEVGGIGREPAALEADIAAWELINQMTLPPELRLLYSLLGGIKLNVASALDASMYAYSPLIALLPLNLVGWTEVFDGEEEPETFQDDARTTGTVLQQFNAGHEFDDEYVCRQLCGGMQDDGAAKTTRVLLIGAPMDCHGNRNSRMFLNIRPCPAEDGRLVGDGLLYRLDGMENGDSELVRVGTALDWINASFLAEVDMRMERGDPGQLVAKRYPALAERIAKRTKQEDESEEDSVQ